MEMKKVVTFFKYKSKPFTRFQCKNMVRTTSVLLILLHLNPILACKYDATTFDQFTYDQRFSLEPVCIAAQCAHENRDKEKQNYGKDLTNTEYTVSEKSIGAQIFENLLTGQANADGVTMEMYMNEILIPMAYFGIVLFVLNLYAGVNGACSRLICTCLCPKKRCCCTCAPQTSRPYTNFQGMLPTVGFGITGLVAVILAIVGMAAGSGAFANAFIRGTCMVDTTRVRLSGFIDQLTVPVNDLNDEFSTVVVAATSKLQTTDGISNSTKTMLDAFDHLISVSEDSTCGHDVAMVAKETKAAVKKGAADALEEIQKVADDIRVNLVDKKDTIEGVTSGAVEMLEGMQTQTDEGMHEASKQAVKAAKTVAFNLSHIVSGPFVWVYVVVLAASVGIVMQYMCRFYDDINFGDLKTNENMSGNIHRLNLIGGLGARAVAVAWFVGLICAATTGAIAAVAVPGVQLYTDACQAMIDLPLKMTTTTTSETQTNTTYTTTTTNEDGTVTEESHSEIDTVSLSESTNSSDIDMIGSCWKNMSVTTILGMDSSLTFEKINFNMEKVDMGKDDMNILEDKVNKNECNVNNDATLTGVVTGYGESQGNEDKEVKDKEIKDAFAALLLAFDATEKSAKDYQTNIQSIETEVAKLQTSADNIKTAGSCGFIKTTWEETYNILCEDGKNAFNVLAICCQLLTLVGFLLGLILLYVNRRCGGHGPIKASDDRTKVDPGDDYDDY